MSLLGSQKLKHPSSKYILIFLRHCLERSSIVKNTIWPFKLTGNGIICIQIFLTFHIRRHSNTERQLMVLCEIQDPNQHPQPHTRQAACAGISWLCPQHSRTPPVSSLVGAIGHSWREGMQHMSCIELSCHPHLSPSWGYLESYLDIQMYDDCEMV